VEDDAMIHDLCTGASMSNAGNNRRPMLATGRKTPERTPWELLAWSLLELAIEDVAILARYGLITKDGECLPWPSVTRTNWRGERQTEHMTIACMNHPHSHHRLKEFWHDQQQGQHWCDLVGCRLPAHEIWDNVLKNHAK
jgi:hypothetical protein